jgi:hypothetical protein
MVAELRKGGSVAQNPTAGFGPIKRFGHRFNSRSATLPLSSRRMADFQIVCSFLKSLSLFLI